MTCRRSRPGRSWCVALGISTVLAAGLTSAAELRVETTAGADAASEDASGVPPAIRYADQLPHSRVTRGQQDVALVYLAAPTDRYRHGVLGDGLEAGSLVVHTRDKRQLRFDLPPDRVFEDLEPRVADFDRDGRDEVVLVESDARHGASLAVYGLRDGKVAPLARGPFIGTAHRWLNPLGVGDFDGDGRLDLAAVVTPHIGGVLTMYRYAPDQLIPMAKTGDVSTHRLGSTELGMGVVVAGHGTPDRLLVPDNTHHRMRLLALRKGQLVQLAAADLGSRLASALHPEGNNRWTARLADGRSIRITVTP